MGAVKRTHPAAVYWSKWWKLKKRKLQRDPAEREKLEKWLDDVINRNIYK